MKTLLKQKKKNVPFSSKQFRCRFSKNPQSRGNRGPNHLEKLGLDGSVSRSWRVTEHRRHLEGRTLERRLGTRDVASGGWHGICKTPFVTRPHKNPSNAALDWQQPCATGTPCLPVVGNYALQNRDTTTPTLRPLPTLLGEALRSPARLAPNDHEDEPEGSAGKEDFAGRNNSEFPLDITGKSKNIIVEYRMDV